MPLSPSPFTRAEMMVAAALLFAILTGAAIRAHRKGGNPEPVPAVSSSQAPPAPADN